MKNYKRFIADQLKGHTVHFVCDCLVRLDVSGLVVDYDIVNNEIIYIIDSNSRIIKIGENTPKLQIEIK